MANETYIIFLPIYVLISRNALQAIGTHTVKESTSLTAWHISTPFKPKK